MTEEQKLSDKLKEKCNKGIEKLKDKHFFDKVTNKSYKFYYELGFYKGKDPDFEGFSYYLTYMEPDIKNIEEKYLLIKRALKYFENR